MIRIGQLKISVKTIHSLKKEGQDEKEILLKQIQKQYHIKTEDVKQIKIIKKSIDARKKEEIKYVYTIEASLEREQKYLNKIKDKNVSKAEQKKYEYSITGAKQLKDRPVVVGSGPAGLFCAYFLALEGYRPILLERGKSVEE